MEEYIPIVKKLSVKKPTPKRIQGVRHLLRIEYHPTTDTFEYYHGRMVVTTGKVPVSFHAKDKEPIIIEKGFRKWLLAINHKGKFRITVNPDGTKICYISNQNYKCYREEFDKLIREATETIGRKEVKKNGNSI